MAVQVKASNECGRRVESMAVADLRDEAELLRQQIALEERVHQVGPVSQSDARLWLSAGVAGAQGTSPQSGFERLSLWSGLYVFSAITVRLLDRRPSTGVPAPASCHNGKA